MIQYFTKRVLMIVPIVLAVILIMFILLYALPGTNPRALSSFGGGDALDSVFETLKLGDNLFTKYIRYCYNALTKFDFGTSAKSGPGMNFELSFRLKRTLLLTGLGLTATLLIGIPAGICAAVHKDKWQDNAITFFSVLFSSVPNYCLALLLVIFAVMKLKIPPSFGFQQPSALILPTITISVGGIAITTRMTRSSMLSVLDQQYIMALRSKGLRERAVIYIHALKNSLIPVIAVLSELTGQLLCGAMVVERFFNIPGIGAYLVTAISSRDSYAILGGTVLISLILSVVSVATDIIYVLVNPDIRLHYTRGLFKKSGKGDIVEA